MQPLTAIDVIFGTNDTNKTWCIVYEITMPVYASYNATRLQ